jgi:hypothetical protein
MDDTPREILSAWTVSPALGDAACDMTAGSGEVDVGSVVVVVVVVVVAAGTVVVVVVTGVASKTIVSQ